MRQVNIFTIQKSIGNHTSIRVLRKEFGDNIPQFNPLEGGDYNGPQYLCCVDRAVDFESICEKYNYRYYPSYKFKIDETKYNSEYEIRQTYFNREQPYRLEKYVSPTYYDSEEESK